MSEPFEVAAARLSLAIADVQDELAEAWDATLGRWAGPSKFPIWAAHRREMAYQTFQRWPVSLGGTVPDDRWLATHDPEHSQ